MASSGHGGQTPDLDGDEDDGFDEVIYPVDFKNAGHVVDDESDSAFSSLTIVLMCVVQCELAWSTELNTGTISWSNPCLLDVV